MDAPGVIETASATPFTSPSFPRGPYRYANREHLSITYRTDRATLELAVPEPLYLRAIGAVRIHRHGKQPRVRALFKGRSAHPVLEATSGVHLIADLTLNLGEVVHDYLTT